MKITVRVKPNSGQDSIEKVDENQFIVRVKAKPHKGKANQAAIGVLAEYFHTAKSRISLLRGQNSRQKTFEIMA